MKRKFLSTILTAAAGAGVFLFLLMISCIITAIPVYFLWNWLMPAVFGIKTVTFIEAVGISLLCGCLFKSSSSSNKSN